MRNLIVTALVSLSRKDMHGTRQDFYVRGDVDAKERRGEAPSGEKGAGDSLFYSRHADRFSISTIILNTVNALYTVYDRAMPS